MIPLAAKGSSSAVFFLACFCLSVLIFFSLSKAKVETYILPCWFSFAVLTGIWLAKAVDAVTEVSARSFSFLSGACFVSAVVAAAALVALPGFAAAQHSLAQHSSSMNEFAPAANMLAQMAAVTNHALAVISPAQRMLVISGVLVLCGGWLYQGYLYRLGRLPECLVSMVLPAVLAAALLTPITAQLIYQLKAADIEAVAIQGRGLKLAIFQEFKPSLMFYARQPIDTFFAPGQLVPTAANETRPQYLIASDKSILALQATHGKRFKLIYKRGIWGLYLAQGLTLVHLPSLEQTFRQDLNLSVGNYHWGTLPFASGE